MQTPRVTVPWGVMKWIAYTGIVFLAYVAVSGVIAREAALMAVVIGVACGRYPGRVSPEKRLTITFLRELDMGFSRSGRLSHDAEAYGEKGAGEVVNTPMLC